MWGVGLIMLAIFGIFLMSLFGNITVTNQQDYTALKNTVEAAMYDAIDLSRFRSGFCVCTSIAKNEQGKWVFKSSDEYSIIKDNIIDGVCPATNGQKCEYIEGEYLIDKEVFAESFVRRFAESVKGNDEYQLVIKDIIEYPPKVSVVINSKNTNDVDGSSYTINNSIDAILEIDSSIPDEITISGGTCEPEDISCDSNGTCVDSKGNDCGKVEFERCKTGDIKCDVIQYKNFYKQTCKDSKGNVCSDIQYNIPDVTVPVKEVQKQTAEQTKKNIKTGGCFPVNTKILTKNGNIAINKIKIGDIVLTYNEEKNINEYKKVKNVFVINNLNEELYTIKTDDTKLILTSEHGVYTKRDNEFVYVMAKNLKIGDVMRYSNGQLHEITEITSKPLTETVYNIETEDNHNFYVGETGVLVHNASAAVDTGRPVDGTGHW